jgi:zinc protease
MRRLSFVLILVAAAACGGSDRNLPTPPPPAPVALTPVAPPTVAAPLTTPDAVFRNQPPSPDGAIPFVPPKIVETKLKNGMRVLLVERHDLPIVAVRLVLTLGAGDVTERAGLASFVGSMLEQGTKKRTALQLSDDFEAIGAGHGSWVDWDSGGVTLKVLTERLDTGLDMMADVALAPTFPQAEIERLQQRRITGIKAERSNPSAITNNAASAALFGRSHPYGHSMYGEEADAKALTRADIVRVYDRLFAPQNAALVVAGDVTEVSILPKLEAAFGSWKNKPNAATRKPPKTPAKAATEKRIVYVDRAGPQSQIQLMRAGVPHSVKDRDAYLVTNAIFGGMFSSRVNLNLREKNAYTYGARSYFSMRHGAGPFLVGAAVHADKTGAAIKEVLNELEAIRKDGPTEDELALAKESIRLAMPGRFEGISDVAAALADLVIYDLPLDEYEKRVARVDAVTAADVKKIAVEYLGSDAMTIIVVGERATVTPQLDALGLGARDERDDFGNPLTAAATKR